MREPYETADGVIPGAITIPLAEILADPARAGSGPVVVVCKVGARALRAARALQAAGIEASVLTGGMDAWDAASRPRVTRVSAARARPRRRRTSAPSRSISPIVLDAAAPLESYPVPVSVARGRTLREPVTARVDIPVFDNSAMDGFAVLFDDVADASADSPVTLTVVADLPAGTELDPPLARGQAARIMTGSPTPDRRDRGRPVRRHASAGSPTRSAQITVVRAPRAPGAHIRRRGEDAVVGDELLPAGHRHRARCRPRPRRRPASPTSWSRDCRASP